MCAISNKSCTFGGNMRTIIKITHPFESVEEFQKLVGLRLSGMIHRLAGRYPQLVSSCGIRRVLIAVSVAWSLSAAARDGNMEAFAHIDEALQPPSSFGCVMQPPNGYVMVDGQPFVISSEEQSMLRFLWDGFTIFIDGEGVGKIKQDFFDFADHQQKEAYAVMREYEEEKQATEKHQEERRLAEKHQETQAIEKHQEETLSGKTNMDSSDTDRLPTQGKIPPRQPLEEYMDMCIEYASDIDKVADDKVESIKDMLEDILDSPKADGIGMKRLFALSKRIRGIKRMRLERKSARAAMENAKWKSMTNNFYAPIANQVLTANQVASSIDKNPEG